MKGSTILVVAIVLSGIIGDMYFRNTFQTIWIIIWALFIVYLIIHGWMDHKGMFWPKQKNKNEEG